MAASLVAMLFANSAIAGTWTATAAAASYASELFGDGTVPINPGTAGYQFNVAPQAGQAFNVTYTLAGATWGTALTSGSLALKTQTATIPTGSGTASITLVDGGGIADTTAKFRLDVTAAFTAPAVAKNGLILTYDFDGATAMTTPTSTVKLSVALADTLGTLDTAGVATNVAVSAEGTGTTVVPQLSTSTPALKSIDVSTGSTKFAGLTAAAQVTNVLGTFTILNATGPVEDDGATAWQIGVADAASTAAAGNSISVKGDLSAAVAVDADANPLTNDGVVMSGCITANATTLSATEATWAFTDTNIVAMETAGACTITLNIDGTTLLVPQTPTLTFTSDYANADYRDENTTGNLASLAKNGASAAVDLILTPGGVFDGFVRVVNRSGVTGKVIVTMYNDAGDVVVFDLSGGTLAGQASTALVAASDLYTQAQAADPTFAHSDGKLRAIFEGEFSAISAQSVTISTDNTTFSTF